jgi:hypothetical protein
MDDPGADLARPRRRPPPDDDLIDMPGMPGDQVSLTRRFVTAAVVLVAAFSVGIAMAVVWQLVGGSDSSENASSSASRSESPSVGASPTTAPTPSATAAAVPVPPDWVAYTDATQQATFSHPPGWGITPVNTGVFFGEPAAESPNGFGAQTIGVVRTTAASPQQAVTDVQQTVYGSASLPGFAPGTPTQANDGSGAWGVSGSYDREGEKVAYAMRSVQAPNAIYVLVARSPAAQQQQLMTLLGALQTSFRPA